MSSLNFWIKSKIWPNLGGPFHVISGLTKDYPLRAICSCPVNSKKHMCIHILGLSIQFKYLKAPAVAKSLPIGQKRKQGRPALAKKALLIQWKRLRKSTIQVDDFNFNLLNLLKYIEKNYMTILILRLTFNFHRLIFSILIFSSFPSKKVRLSFSILR